MNSVLNKRNPDDYKNKIQDAITECNSLKPQINTDKAHQICMELEKYYLQLLFDSLKEIHFLRNQLNKK